MQIFFQDDLQRLTKEHLVYFESCSSEIAFKTLKHLEIKMAFVFSCVRLNFSSNRAFKASLRSFNDL